MELMPNNNQATTAFFESLFKANTHISDEARVVIGREGKFEAKEGRRWRLRCIRTISGLSTPRSEVKDYFRHKFFHITESMLSTVVERKPELLVRDMKEMHRLLEKMSPQTPEEKEAQEAIDNVKESNEQAGKLLNEMEQAVRLSRRFLERLHEVEALITKMAQRDIILLQEIKKAQRQGREQRRALTTGRWLRILTTRLLGNLTKNTKKKRPLSEGKARELANDYDQLMRPLWEALEKVSDTSSPIDLTEALKAFQEEEEKTESESQEAISQAVSMRFLLDFLFEEITQGGGNRLFHTSVSCSSSGSPSFSSSPSSPSSRMTRSRSSTGSRTFSPESSSFFDTKKALKKILQQAFPRLPEQQLRALLQHQKNPQRLSVLEVGELFSEAHFSQRVAPLITTIVQEVRPHDTALAALLEKAVYVDALVFSWRSNPESHRSALKRQMEQDGILLPHKVSSQDTQMFQQKVADYIDNLINQLYDHRLSLRNTQGGSLKPIKNQVEQMLTALLSHLPPPSAKRQLLEHQAF